PSEARIQELIRQAAERAGTSVARRTQSAGPQTDARQTVRLSLDDAVKFSLDRNLDIAVQRLSPQLNDLTVASARAAYRPVTTSTISQNSLTQTPTSQTQ